MKKLVMYATAPESIAMIDCHNSRDVLNRNGEVLVLPKICRLGKRCSCLREEVNSVKEARKKSSQ